MLANRVNEITSGVESIDVSNQITTLETKIEKEFKEYVNHNELVRDDEIDIFLRVDNEYNVLLFVVGGLIVFKIFAKDGESRMLIKIADGIPSAKCKDDRVD